MTERTEIEALREMVKALTKERDEARAAGLSLLDSAASTHCAMGASNHARHKYAQGDLHKAIEKAREQMKGWRP